jgi:signal transduction histidine kinase
VSSTLPARRFREARWLIGATIIMLVAMVMAEMLGLLAMARFVEEEDRSATLAAAQIAAYRLAGADATRFDAGVRAAGWGVAVLANGRIVDSIGEAGPEAPWWPWPSRDAWEAAGRPVAGPVQHGARRVLVAYVTLSDGKVVRTVAPQAAAGAADRWRRLGALLAVSVAVGTGLLASVLLARVLAPYRELLAEAARVSPLREAESEDRFLVETFRATVTRLEASEAAVRRRADDFEVLTEVLTRESQSGVVITTAAGAVRAANTTATELTGADLKAGDAMPASLAFGEGRIALGQRVVEVRRFPLRAASGEPGGEVVLLSDRTAFEALERAVREHEQMAALGELSAGMAHELRNALATIRGYLRLLSGSEAVERARFLAAIDDEAAGVALLLDRFLRFAQPGELRREQVEVVGLVREAAARVATALPQSEIEVHGNPLMVRADPLALGVAVENLLRNGAEAAGTGKVIATVSSTPEHAVIVVEDDGPGVSAELRDRLFVPFASSKPSGGLGLALARRFARLHGGELVYQDRAQGGARFVIQLPREVEV